MMMTEIKCEKCGDTGIEEVILIDSKRRIVYRVCCDCEVGLKRKHGLLRTSERIDPVSHASHWS